jgi:molybdate/tungstate transport system substrate-binding protein
MHAPVRTALRRTSLVAAVSTAALVGVAGSPGSVAGAAPVGSGPVNVLYAGSLATVMQDSVGPAFQRATGYDVSGFAGGSDDLASQIKGGIEKGDVFISASPSVNVELEGTANGDRVSWYATFAVSPLVIGYNPNSSFARDLAKEPWYNVITKTGFQLGRTDPATDPKGVLAVSALDKAAKLFHNPALRAITASTAGVFPEETLVGRLQAGQLDAGFFYAVEASAAKIPTVSLGNKFEYHASYTVTILNQAPDEHAAISFVTFLLSKKGSEILSRAGMTLTKVGVTGSKSAVPKALRTALHMK